MTCASGLRRKALQSLYCKFSKVKQAKNVVHHCDHVFIVAEQEMDGNAIAMGLASAPGPDWLNDIPTLGTRLK